MDGLKIGSAYFEIYAKSEKLKAQMADYTGLVKKTADNFEDAFKNAKLDIDNRVLTMKFSQLEGLHKALVRQLQQKIKMDADVASIEKTRIAIKSVEDALIKTKGATVNYGPVGMSFGRIIQDSAYVTQGFGFWINAVGNNITNFAENVSYARQRGESFKAMLSGMFTGVNAWMTVINIAVSVITAFALANRDSKKDVESNTEAINRQKQAVDELRRSYEDWEKRAKDVGELMRKVSRGEVDSLKEQKALTIANIALLDAKLKAANKPGKLSSFMSQEEVANAKSQLAAYKASLAELNDALLLVDAQFRNAGQAGDNFNSNLGTKTKKEIVASISPASEQVLESLRDEIALRDKIYEVTASINDIETKRMSKLTEGIANAFRDEDLENIRQQMSELFDNSWEKIAQDIRDRNLAAISELGSALQNAFSKSGNDFVAKLNMALQTAMQIASIINKGESGSTSGVLGIITSAIPFLAALNIQQMPMVPVSTGGNNFNDAGIIGELQAVRRSIEANTIATVKGRGLNNPSQSQDILRQITKLLNEENGRFNRGNIRND